MKRRPGMMLSAAVTVAVPGVLAIIGVLAQQHAVGGQRVSAHRPHALAGRSPVPSPAAYSTSPSKITEPWHSPNVSRAALNSGTSLLGKAATAGQNTSYEGVQVLSQSGVDGTVAMTAHVWHRGGGRTVTQTSSDTRASAPQTAVSYDPDHRSPEGVFGLTRSLVTQLAKHYVAIYQGTGLALGRPAEIVAVYRFDGSLAARFWLDRRTLVPLRRELFDHSDRMISKDAFTQVRFGRMAGQPAAVSKVRTRIVSRWSTAPSPGRVVATLAGQGLRVPGTLPGGLPLQSAQSSGTGNSRVVALEYSDGLYVDTLFVQRGTLTSDMTGWRPVSLAGHHVYVAGRSVAWSGEGSVYTMVADAPPQTVTRDIAALPPSSSPGFLTRIGRGLSRLASLLNPFG